MPQRRRAAGVPLCAVVCVCMFCAPRVRAQEEPAPAPAPPEPAPEPRDEETGSAQEDENETAPAAANAPDDATPAIVPPRPVSSSEAVYPEKALAERREARVELLVTVREDGSVGDVEVAVSGGADFDEAALAAIRAWQFEPARRDGEVVESRIRVPFQFAIPEEVVRETPISVTSAPPPPTSKPEGQTGDTDQADAPDVIVKGERELREEQRSSGDFILHRDVLAAAPHQEGADVLRSAPGVYIGRGEGAAVAHNYMLRGFDAEHGQDIEFHVGGLPINMPSHIHGQGYADLGFLIGDAVHELHVTEGVYDPRQGDFAVAGSIDVELGVVEEERGVKVRSGYGSFNTLRQLVLWAPREGKRESFGAVQYTKTDGFGENRAGQSGSGIFQHRFGKGDVTYRAIGILHAARSDMAGVLREDDVKAGRVCLDCVYPYATARAQNAMAGRFMTGLFADYANEDGANGQVGAFIGYDNFRVQQNFTGFTEESRTLERVGGLGDLIEQQNRTLSLGLTGRYRTSLFRPTSWARGTLEVGADGRLDTIEQSQNLLDAGARNQTWDTRVDASIRAFELGFWGDLDWSFGKYVTYRLGARADVLAYDVDDHLGNFAPLSRPQDTYIIGYRRSALGTAFGPRTSLEVMPVYWLSLLAAYGEGYRSPQARQLDDGEEAPFSKVRSADVGARMDFGDPLSLVIGGYLTHLSDDVAFDASEGRLERIGATRRMGAVAHAVSKPFPWLIGSVSFTFVEATLLEPPPPSADEPQPPFEKGQKLPYVPPIVVRADIGARHTFVDDLGGQPLGGKLGSGLSVLSARPLPYNGHADPLALLDASAGLLWGPVELSFEAFNLLDTEFSALEYSFPSDWDPNDGVRSRVPQRHTAAGSPLSWLVSLGVTL